MRWLIFILFPAVVLAEPFPAPTGTWYEFDKVDLVVDGRKAYVVLPAAPAEDKPWIWRARFPREADAPDRILVSKGFHIGYIDVAGMWGSPAAVRHFDAFYREMTGTYGLSKRPSLIAVGRGALVAYNWAIKNPDKLSCIYGDSPVCDFNSWPGGKGLGQHNPVEWAACLQAWQMTLEEADEFKGQPIHKVEVLADSDIPILHVVGKLDFIVPVSENSDIIRHHYRKLNGSMLVIAKPEAGHNPHGLADPKPIVQFILRNTLKWIKASDAP